jgi:hypothetical protein
VAAACLVCRTRQEDRDLYDFKLKCGNRWTSWSGLWFKSEVEDKEWECPSKMYVTGMEVKRGRREFGDRDTYDFKLQCSGVWQSYLGMKYHGHQEEKRQECPNGEGTSGLKVFRGFVEWGDKDLCALPRLQQTPASTEHMRTPYPVGLPPLSHAAWPAQTRTAARRQATRTATHGACPAGCVAWRLTLAPLGPVPSSHRRVRPELQEHRRQPRLHPGATGPQNAGAAKERAGAPPPPAAGRRRHSHAAAAAAPAAAVRARAPRRERASPAAILGRSPPRAGVGR